jgi:hypothetical protein
MRTLPLSIFITALSLTTAGAQDLACAFTGPTIFPELEAVEAAFLTGDYAGFAALIRASIPSLDEAAITSGVAQAVPGGFESCTTVIQREDVGGLVQEVTLFELPDGKGTISLYLQSALVKGERKITQFSFDGTLTAVLEKLR